MATETRTTDSKGRVSLPKGFANATVIVEQVSETEVVIRKARVIPEDQARHYEDYIPPLSERDWQILMDAMEKPPQPNEALRRLMRGGRKKKSG
jgi:uncharacterized protein (DUF1778 family)